MNVRHHAPRVLRAAAHVALVALWACSPSSSEPEDKCGNKGAGPVSASEIRAGETYEIVLSGCNTCGHCKATIKWTKPEPSTNTGPVEISFLPMCQSGEKAGKYFPNPARRTASVHEGFATLDLGGKIYCGDKEDILWDGTIHNGSPHKMTSISVEASGATRSALTIDFRPYKP